MEGVLAGGSVTYPHVINDTNGGPEFVIIYNDEELLIEDWDAEILADPNPEWNPLPNAYDLPPLLFPPQQRRRRFILHGRSFA